MTTSKWFWMLALLMSQPALAQSVDWTLDREEADISVFIKDNKTSDYIDFHAQAEVQSGAGSVLALLKDPGQCQQWLHLCVSGKVLKTVSDNEFYIYQVFDFPFPFANRDLISHVTIAVDGMDVIEVNATAAPDFCLLNAIDSCRSADANDFVRMTDFTATLLITPITEGQSRITWEQVTDPGDGMTAWIANREIKEIPFNSLKNMKQVLSGG